VYMFVSVWCVYGLKCVTCNFLRVCDACMYLSEWYMYVFGTQIHTLVYEFE